MDMEDYNEDDKFNPDNLGEADEEHTFEKGGVRYFERTWYQNDGGEYKHTSIVDEDGNILPPKTRIITSEDISDKDLHELFKFRKTLPLNFLNALQRGADNYNKADEIRGRGIRVETLDEKLDRLEAEKFEAVRTQMYEKASELRDEILQLRRDNKDVL